MRLLIIISITFLIAALFALGIFLFTKPVEVKELLEPIDTSSYQPNPAVPSPSNDQETSPIPIEDKVQADNTNSPEESEKEKAS